MPNWIDLVCHYTAVKSEHLLYNGKRWVCAVSWAINEFVWFQCKIGQIRGRPFWQKVCVVSRAIYFLGKTGVKFMKVAKLYSTWGYTDEFHTNSAKKHHVVWLLLQVDSRINLLYNSKWAPVSIFFSFSFSFFVIGFSSPKLAIYFAQFCINQNVTILWKGPFCTVMGPALRFLFR